MMEQIWYHLSTYDLPGLREYWRYLNNRLFSRLEQRYADGVQRLESSVLKLYIVNAHQVTKLMSIPYKLHKNFGSNMNRTSYQI